MSQDLLKLSIIVPVYNVEKFLDDCLTSLLYQNVEGGYEVICVDDGSKDGSLSVLEDFAERFPDVIRVFHKENGGVSSARNYGIEKARGKYITFVDSDDYILNDSIGKIVALLEKENLPAALMSGCLSVDEDSSFDKNKQVETFTYGYINIATETCYSMIVSRELVVGNGIRFNENMSYGEDTLFVAACQRYYWGRNILVNEPYYCYRQRENSAMRITKTPRKLSCQMTAIEAYQDIYKGLQEDATAPAELKKLFNIRVDACVVNILFYGLFTGDYLVDDLKARNLYPYRVQWGLIRGGKSFQGLVLKGVKILFAFEWIYKLCYTIYGKFFRKK